MPNTLQHDRVSRDVMLASTSMTQHAQASGLQIEYHEKVQALEK